jgi:hypothetical protein
MELGTLVDMVPKQHANTNSFGEYGFVAVVLPQTDVNNIKPIFVAHSAMEFVRLYGRLSLELQAQGIWLSLAESDSYSAEEKGMVEELKMLCKKRGLFLFTRTGQNDRAWQRMSPQDDPCCSDLAGQRLAGGDYERLSPMEKQLIGTWAMAPTCFRKDEKGQMIEFPIEGGTMEVALTTDHREFWCPDGDGSRYSARWRLEGNDIVLMFDTPPPDSIDRSKEERETIVKLTDTEIVFTDGTTEARWTRVR